MLGILVLDFLMIEDNPEHERLLQQLQQLLQIYPFDSVEILLDFFAVQNFVLNLDPGSENKIFLNIHICTNLVTNRAKWKGVC